MYIFIIEYRNVNRNNVIILIDYCINVFFFKIIMDKFEKVWWKSFYIYCYFNVLLLVLNTFIFFDLEIIFWKIFYGNNV